MKKIVCLISNRVTHNVLFLKEFKNIADEYIFFTTDEMELPSASYSKRLIQTLNIDSNKVNIITVSAYSMKKIEDKLSDINFTKEYEYIINIKGGNKLMSIAIMNYFREFPKVKIYYVERKINSYLQIYPKTNIEEIKFTEKLTIDEYTSAHGMSFITKSHNLTDFRIASELMEQAKKVRNLKKIHKIRNAYKNKSHKEKVFYSGGWFEEYVYQIIKKKLNLSPDQITMKAKIKNDSTQNEYDVVFLYNDSIHLIECKAYLSNYDLKNKVDNALYKLAALDDEFGHRVKSYFINTINLKLISKNERRNYINRANDLHVRVIFLEDFINNTFFDKLLT